MALLLVALMPVLVGGIRLERELPDHYEVNPVQDSRNSSEHHDAVDDPEDVGLVSAMLAEVEKDAKAQTRVSNKKKLEATSVAVVAVGHIRTFVFPGVHSSIKTNLLDTFPGRADFFFVGHTGTYSVRAAGVDVRTYINRSEAAALLTIFAMKPIKVYRKHFEIHDDCECDDLKKARMKSGTTGPECDKANKNLMQVLWMDHAFQLTEQYNSYDLIFRIRPDYAVFKPFPWNSVSTVGLNWECKRNWRNGEADWHFIFPGFYMKEKWPGIVKQFVKKSSFGGQFSGPGYSPDMVWKFPRPFDDPTSTTQREIVFPGVIVRNGDPNSRDQRECCNQIKDDKTHDECLLAMRSQYFTKEH